MRGGGHLVERASEVTKTLPVYELMNIWRVSVKHFYKDVAFTKITKFIEKSKMNNKFPNLSVLTPYHAIQFYDTSHPAHKPPLTYIRERGIQRRGYTFLYVLFFAT